MPGRFPNLLVNGATGIAVGLASSICSFNLEEICDATIALLRAPRTDIDKIMEIKATEWMEDKPFYDQ